MKNAEKSAFPLPKDRDEHPFRNGLTKREYFAAMAMQGLIAAPIAYILNDKKATSIQDMTTVAIECADELLKQLEK